jgi:hypothetical protein
VRAIRPLALREALLLAFLATGVMAAKAALRWHLHLTGHAMLTTVGLLVLARLCVARVGAATVVGLLAGIASALLGMGKGGPLIVVKLVLPALVVDAAGAIAPARLLDTRVAVMVGALAGASHFLPVAVVELVAGLSPAVALGHAAFSAAAKAAFGALGGWGAAVIGARLRDHGLLPAG